MQMIVRTKNDALGEIIRYNVWLVAKRMFWSDRSGF